MLLFYSVITSFIIDLDFQSIPGRDLFSVRGKPRVKIIGTIPHLSFGRTADPGGVGGAPPGGSRAAPPAAKTTPPSPLPFFTDAAAAGGGGGPPRGAPPPACPGGGVRGGSRG